MRYSFQEKPNPFTSIGFHGHTSRRSPVRMVVLHTGEIAADTIGTDMTAENLTSFMGNTPVRVSWHGTTDSDSVIHNLPHSYTGFHVSGYNSSSIGIEQGINAADWNNISASHRNAMIDNIALLTAWYCQIYRIPVQLINKAEADRGLKGIATHGSLNPHNRTDPGPDFPMNDFLAKVKEYSKEQILGIGDEGPSVKAAQQHLADLGVSAKVGIIDGDAGPKFDDAVRAIEKTLGLSSTGLYTKARIKTKVTPPPVDPPVDPVDPPVDSGFIVKIGEQIVKVDSDSVDILIKKA